MQFSGSALTAVQVLEGRARPGVATSNLAHSRQRFIETSPDGSRPQSCAERGTAIYKTS